MTDITELAQSLKAAANTTADAIDRLKEFPGDELIDLSQHEGEQVDIDITTLSEWYELSSPANVLALVEALEKAQQVDEELCKLLPPGVEYMDPPDGGDVTLLEGVRRMVADYRQRIADLESRTVTVKLPPHAPENLACCLDGYETWLIATTFRDTWNKCLDEVMRTGGAGIKWEAE
ncbi:TPA: hypothetical protein ACNIES_003696 [Klebsiella pneumoniae]